MKPQNRVGHNIHYAKSVLGAARARLRWIWCQFSKFVSFLLGSCPSLICKDFFSPAGHDPK